jgi:hypothetical protein
MKSTLGFSLLLHLFFYTFLAAQGAGNAAQFVSDGGGSAITVSSTPELKTFSAITLEVWIKPSGGGEWALVMGKQLNPVDANPWYSYRICKANYPGGWPDIVSFNIAPAAGGGETGIGSATAVQSNVWTHIAGVYDGATMKIYINGKLDGTTSYTGDLAPSDYPLYIGHAPWTNYNNFNGQMDEVRIWNVARTQEQIQNNMHKSISAQTGLVGYWPFNETPPASTTLDASSYNQTGTLAGAASVVAPSTVPIGSEGVYVNTASQTSIGSTGGQMSVTITSTPDDDNNLGIYQSGSLSASPVIIETFPSGVEKRSEVVWGIVKRGTVTANIVLNYGGMGGITNEATLKVLKREDAGNDWQDVTGEFTQNTTDNTFLKTGETSFGEYSIGTGSDNPLPVQLASFIATSTSATTIELNWQTATEVNNYGFSVECKLQSGEWKEIGFVAGAGNSNSIKSYSFIDLIPTRSHTPVYRLKQVNLNGSFSYSKEVEAKADNVPAEFSVRQNFPNPFNPTTRIEYSIPMDNKVEIKVYNILGMEVAELLNENQAAGRYNIEFNANHLSSGIYFYKVVSGNFFEIKKMILLR